MHIVITGGAGFIGQAIIRQITQDLKVTIIDTLEPQVHGNDAHFSSEMIKRARCIKADIRDTDKYRDRLENAECVIHLASQTGTGQSMYEISRYVRHNVDGTAKLLEALAETKMKPRKIILASSRAVYGEGAYQNQIGDVVNPQGRSIDQLKAGLWEIYCDDNSPLQPLKMKETHACLPTSIYGMTKLWQEQLVSHFAIYNNIRCDIFRLQNVYGEGQSITNPYTGIVNLFATKILNNDIVDIYEDGRVTRDFVYVKDVAWVFNKAMLDATIGSRILNVGSGVPTDLLLLVATISNILHKQPKILMSGKFRHGDIRHAHADLTNLLNAFPDYMPKSLEDGLRRYLHWFCIQTKPEADFDLVVLRNMVNKNVLHKAN